MEDDRYYIHFSGSFLDFKISPGDFATERKDSKLWINRHIPPRCPECGSYEVAGERPLWKEREHENVLIPFTCDSCGHQFDMEATVIVTNYL